MSDWAKHTLAACRSAALVINDDIFEASNPSRVVEFLYSQVKSDKPKGVRLPNVPKGLSRDAASQRIEELEKIAFECLPPIDSVDIANHLKDVEQLASLASKADASDETKVSAVLSCDADGIELIHRVAKDNKTLRDMIDRRLLAKDRSLAFATQALTVVANWTFATDSVNGRKPRPHADGQFKLFVPYPKKASTFLKSVKPLWRLTQEMLDAPIVDRQAESPESKKADLHPDEQRQSSGPIPKKGGRPRELDDLRAIIRENPGLSRKETVTAYKRKYPQRKPPPNERTVSNLRTRMKSDIAKE